MAGKHGNFPAWLTLGFALGLAFGGTYFGLSGRGEDASPKPAEMKSGAPPASLAFATIPDPPRDVAKLGELEEIFQAWGGYAVWSNGVTQFALWNGETDAHTDFYEVRRANRRFYFRTLPRADWPLIDHGEMVRCPMWFAETPAMRERFYREHPEEKPGRPVLRRWPERPPLLPPLPPKEGESPATGSPLSPSPGGGEQLVPPWEATPPAHN